MIGAYLVLGGLMPEGCLRPSVQNQCGQHSKLIQKKDEEEERWREKEREREIILTRLE